MVVASVASVFLVLALQGFAVTVRKTLPVVNKAISPDGFNRSSVILFLLQPISPSANAYNSAILAGSTFPGALISANKGDDFAITVSDQLTDGTMVKSTSIHWHGSVLSSRFPSCSLG
jgi:iron transport multicopper oxidase